MSESVCNQDYTTRYPHAIEDVYQAEDMAYAGKEYRDRAARRRSVGRLIFRKAVIGHKDRSTILYEQSKEPRSRSEIAKIADEEFLIARLASRALCDNPRAGVAADNQYERARKHDRIAEQQENAVAKTYERFVHMGPEEINFIPAGIMARVRAEVADEKMQQPLEVSSQLQFYGAAAHLNEK